MIGRLLLNPARRLHLPGGLPAGAGGVLMRPGDRGVHADIPGNQPSRVGAGLQPGHDLLPHPDGVRAVSGNGVLRDPAGASAEQGAELFRYLVERADAALTGLLTTVGKGLDGVGCHLISQDVVPHS
ncbi:hypothetical protein GCM10010199_11440 [Dactylosporangium roseum]